jgi:glucose 1-dehydrogenase
MSVYSEKRPLEGQRAMVTGANTGIGAAIVEALADAGAKVLINYVSGRDKAEALAERIRAKDAEAIVFEADVSREHQVKEMFRAAIDAWGSLDILVNNAGLQKDAPLMDMSLEDWELVLRVNLTGQFLCSREAAREFRRRGVVPEISHSAGKIICMSSVHDVIPWAGHVNYAASKGGVNMLMKTLAQELAMHKIRVNGISPGAIKTCINYDAWMTAERETQLLELIPYGRVGHTRDIAKAAVWLSSDESDYVTGATLYVDGGMTLYPGFENGG